MNLWNDIKVGPASFTKAIHAVIEIPMGSKNKYEYNRELEAFTLDNVAYTFYYPVDYGIIPKTLGDDGNPINILVMMRQPTFPGCVIETRPIGVMRMLDGGESDDKIIGVPVNDPRFKDVKDISDLPKAYLDEVGHFFTVYKNLEGKTTDVLGWESTEKALEAINHSIELYNERF